MASNDQTRDALPAARKKARRCRLFGVSTALLGLAAAGAIYWRAAHAPDYSADPAMLGFHRNEERQMGILYGRQGRLIEDLTNSLKQPGTQAFLVVAAAAVIATGCFYFARHLEDGIKPASTGGPHSE
jgi:hypothetical protein